MQSFFALLLASCLGNGYSAVVSRVTKTPKTVFMLAVMISLVPGKGLYQTMRYAVDGVWSDCFTAGISTLVDILGIATGMVVVLIVEKAVHEIRGRMHRLGTHN